MYNEEVKNRYFDEVLSGSDSNTRSIFNFIGDFEENLQIDFAVMSEVDRIEYIETRCYTDASKLRSDISAMNRYIEWYRKTFSITQPPYRKDWLCIEKYDFGAGMEGHILGSESEFLSILRNVCPLDAGYECVAGLCLAWLGLSKKEAVELLEDEIDFGNRAIVHKNKIIASNISPEILEILKSYSITNEAQRTQNQTYTVYADRDGKHFLHRMISKGSNQAGKPFTAIRLTASINWLQEQTEKDVSYGNVFRSGCLWRIYQLDQSGYNLYRRSNATHVKAVYRAQNKGLTASDILLMYECYKKRFHPED